MNAKPQQKEEKKENINGNSMDKSRESHKKTESNNSEAFQVIVTDVRGRSKTERIDPIATDFLQKTSSNDPPYEKKPSFLNIFRPTTNHPIDKQRR